MKNLTCASEVVPFAKTGGLADVAGALPAALADLGHEVIVTLPYYKEVKAKNLKLKKINDDFLCAKVSDKLNVYFVINDALYGRDGLYGTKTGDHPDNLERFIFYNRKTLELLKILKFKADILHAHDWQAALSIIYLKNTLNNDPFYKNIKTLFTIHNIGYQGLFEYGEYQKLGLDPALFNMEALEFYGKINLLKGGIVYSDAISTVSDQYSKEIQTQEYGFGLEGILAKRRKSLFGIINGLDYAHWDPQTDKLIAKNFSFKTVSRKSDNKKDLQKICSLNPSDAPLFGMVTRLAEQKGLDIFAQIIEDFCKLDLQLVILGTGEERYHKILEEIAKKYPKKAAIHLTFDNTLAHKIYAGSDIFLMPSKYEPCGLGQMISLSYGTIPLVYKTGGLADTVTAGNGFVFDSYDKDDFLAKVKESLAAYKNKKNWLALVKNAMSCNFSWKESAKKYVELYRRLK